MAKAEIKVFECCIFTNSSQQIIINKFKISLRNYKCRQHQGGLAAFLYTALTVFTSIVFLSVPFLNTTLTQLPSCRILFTTLLILIDSWH